MIKFNLKKEIVPITIVRTTSVISALTYKLLPEQVSALNTIVRTTSVIGTISFFRLNLIIVFFIPFGGT